MATVDQLQNTALAHAQGFVNDAKTALDAAALRIEAIDEGEIEFALPLTQPFVEPAAITRPELRSVDFVAPDEPEAPEALSAISELEFDPIPVFNAVAPELALPSRPAEIGSFDKAPPLIDIDARFPEIPAALENFDLEAPTLPERSAPTRLDFSLPSFDDAVPDAGAASVGDLSARFVSAYREAAPQMMEAIDARMDAWLIKHNPRHFEQLNLIENQLAKFLAGGTGTNAAVEGQIFERAKSKINAEYLRALAIAEQEAARRGHTLPPGSLRGAQMALRRDAGDNQARAATEVAINAFEREQAVLQFAVTASAQMRQQATAQAIQYESGMIAINAQAIDHAQDIVNFIVAAFNSEVERARLQLQNFQARVSLFETLMKRATAAIDIYRSEISALEAMTNIDRAKIEIYNSRISALSQLSGLYKTQVDAVISKAELQKLKLDVFKIEAETYSLQVAAKNSEYQAYSAALAGEEAKFRVFEARAGAYSQQLSGYRAKVDAQSAQLSAQVQRNRSITEQYNARLNAFSTIVSARSDVAKTDLESQRLGIAAYQAETSAAIAVAQSRASYYQGLNQVGIEQARLFTQQSLDKAKLKLEKTQKIADASLKIGAIYESAAGAAMSGTISMAAATISSSSE